MNERLRYLRDTQLLPSPYEHELYDLGCATINTFKRLFTRENPDQTTLLICKMPIEGDPTSGAASGHVRGRITSCDGIVDGKITLISSANELSMYTRDPLAGVWRDTSGELSDPDHDIDDVDLLEFLSDRAATKEKSVLSDTPLDPKDDEEIIGAFRHVVSADHSAYRHTYTDIEATDESLCYTTLTRYRRAEGDTYSIEVASTCADGTTKMSLSYDAEGHPIGIEKTFTDTSLATTGQDTYDHAGIIDTLSAGLERVAVRAESRLTIPE